MRKKSEEQVLLNHGWEHFWCNPKNLYIKEFVKGPFINPKLLNSIPYVTLNQEDGSSVRLLEGIPDCWVEYLAHNLAFLRKCLLNYELMPKEDVEIVPQLRKNYRLYIGQGIPDPWTSYPYACKPEVVAHINPKEIKKHLLNYSRRKKENCYCCEKKYLFECPDKTNLKACRCRDCHEKNTTLITNCGKNCKCISALRDWVLKNTDLRQRKNQRRKPTPESDLSSSDDSKTEDEGPRGKSESLMLCECPVHKDSSDVSTSELGEANEKHHNFNNRNKILYKNQTRICCCPYVRNSSLRRNSSPLGRNCPESIKTISKQIQTENEKDSKTVQTDNSKSKVLLRCQCSSLCPQCGVYQCRTPWAKVACATPQSVSNRCFTPGIIQNSAILCPYSFPNHVIIQKPSNHDDKKTNKKREKNRVSEDGSALDFRCKRRQSKVDDESVLRKSGTKVVPTDAKNEDFNNNKSIYYCQSSAKGFDHFKYLTDEKLKSYLQRDERLPGMPSHSGSKFINFCRGDPSVSTLNRDRFKFDRFKGCSGYKPKFSESVEDCKTVYLGNGKRHSYNKQFNSSDQATMTMSEETQKSKKEVNCKLKYFKDAGESDEFRSFDLFKNCNGSYKANRRRRRLLANRKRRRKLAASGKSCILEYQALLNKLPKRSELVNKQVQVEGNEQDFHFSEHFSKKISFTENNPSISGLLNFHENNSLRCKDASFNSNPLIAGTLKRIEQENGKNHASEYSESRALGKCLRQPLRSDMIFSKALEKISNGNRGTWTSNALKNIIDHILIEKKSQEK